jgi:hypothetical protein
MLMYTRIVMAIAVISLCLSILISLFGAPVSSGLSLVGIPMSMLFLWIAWTNWVDAAKCATEWAPEAIRNQGFFGTEGYKPW